MATATQHQEQLGHTLIGFSRDGLFPEQEEVSAALVNHADLPAALIMLASARFDLEKEVQDISSECAPSVDAWIENATALQNDIDRSKRLASEIIRQANIGDALQQVAHDEAARVTLLEGEVAYNAQLKLALKRIIKIKETLDDAEHARLERQILMALQLLSSACDAIHAIPDYDKTRAIRLLDERASTIKASLEEEFGAVWAQLISVDRAARTITIHENIGVGMMNVQDAVAIMHLTGKMEDSVSHLKKAFADIIVRPRIDLEGGQLSSIVFSENSISASAAPADRTIKSLFLDLEQIVRFLREHLPLDFVILFSQALMPNLCLQIRSTWLESAVPASLSDMPRFRKVIIVVQAFIDNLNSLQLAGVAELQDWVTNAPRIWLSKRRETCLDWTRNQLALGTGLPRRVDRIETQTISVPEGRQIGSNGNDWDSAWSDNERETTSPVKSRESPVKTQPSSRLAPVDTETSAEANGKDDEGADAWGWDDEDIGIDGSNGGPEAISATSYIEPSSHERMVTLTEKYSISSMPDPVLKTIITIIDDGITLTNENDEANPVTVAAVGLFAFPTLVLALYRAVSPYYYTLTAAGNMYLYNDAMWLAEQLRNYSEQWKTKKDLPQRSHGKVKLNGDIVAVENFGKRAYGNEMSTQRTILSDLLGGAQNFLQQEGQTSVDDEATVETVIALIRNLSVQWKGILTKSAWAQATGSLLSTVAKKIILDVQDLSSLGADEAYRIANLIAKVVKLDDLFLPENEDQPQIPVTSQYAPYWLKLHFLSEVLQSNLKDVRYLWFESDLSLYFNAQEVVDLIELSFENSPRSREVIAAIRENLHPRGEDEGSGVPHI